MNNNSKRDRVRKSSGNLLYIIARPCGGCSVAAAPPGVAVGRRRAPLEPPPPQRPAPAGCSLARRRPQRQRHRQQQRRRRGAARAVWVAFSGVCCGRRERLEGRQGSGRRQERGERSGQRMAVRRRQRLGPGGGRALPAALLLLLLCVWCRAAAERVRYAIAEELGRGSLVGPLARDLGLSADELPARKLQVASGGKKQLKYFTVNEENGNLYVNERLDREEMCGESATCSVSFEALVHNPLNVFHVEVAIEDVNDNSPVFSKAALYLEIGEWTVPGARFPLEMARDADAGSNSMLTYQLTSNPSFSLSMKEKPGGSKLPELVLERVLDREKQSSFELVLMAVDGGDPARSGTVQVRINVTDANDNPPVFNKSLYEARVSENLPLESVVLQVRATDADAGSNGRVSYSLGSVPDSVRALFTIDSESGEVRTAGPLDFEEKNKYVFGVEARDGGGLASHCEVQIDITDENDNAPEITILSLSSPVPEDAPAGTVVAVLNVDDSDSGENGQVSCELSGEAPLSIVASSGGSYKVVTSGALDREQASEHRVTVVARDRGRPALRSSRELVLEVSDVNDNAPVFEEAAYSAYVAENNAAGALVLRVQARDADAGANGRVSYWLAGGSAGAAGAAPLVSVEARSGALYAQRSLDYEQCREFTVAVRAQDGGSPARSSTATVRVFVLDRNDNAPRVLWPAAAAAGPGEAAGGAAAAPFEVVPRSAEAGYLVAKVVAVDADAGRNAWLSYELVQASEPALFRVGLHSGEVRTARAVGERDAAKQRLVAVVKDHGQPALSATATLHVVLAESLQEALPELSERPAGAEAAAAELQFYLVLALALLSALLVLSVALAVLARLRRAGPPAVLRCLGAQRFSLAGAAFPADFCEGTLPYSYNLCVPPPARAVPEAAWPPPPPVPILSAEELLGGDSCEKPSQNSDLVVVEQSANPDSPQVCKACCSSVSKSSRIVFIVSRLFTRCQWVFSICISM
ncbi:protocadherin gamma-B5-like [Melospiza melodia melodia]|uniref:protocadherin gamma-B5-like n=1 Tax=Melospiza melodia melodia TaxID=1914991 RepID=UPI002FD02B16